MVSYSFYLHLYVISSCLICCIFFFFKQKTAYEMRISDWSSDVCSSDLKSGTTILSSAYRPLCGRNNLADAEVKEKSVKLQVANARAEESEIGRASCRERVCQYV